MKKRLLLLILLGLSGFAGADSYRDYVEPGTRNDYTGNAENFSRRTDHFLFRVGPVNKQGILTEQLFQTQLQFLEHTYDTWRKVGLHELGGMDEVKYRSVVEPGQSWEGDLEGTAVGFGFGNEIPGLHIPANALLATSPNGCTPHELGHGWQNQGRALGGGLPAAASPGYTEALANWVMQLNLVDYPHDWPAVGVPFGHTCMSYNCMSIFNVFLDEPGYGVDFINDLIYGKNLNSHADMGADDMVRKAIRLEPNGAKDKAGAIHDVLGHMNAKMLNMDFWNYHEDMPYGVHVDREFEGFFFNRIKMTRQPGVEKGWLRPVWSCVPQYLMNNFIPLEVEGRKVECDFRPVPDPMRKSAFRACFVAFDARDRPRYSKLWNAGKKSFALADDDVSVYLAIIAIPEKANPSMIHNDYRSENPAIFPYRIKLTGATAREWEWKKPNSGARPHPNGGGLVADSAKVADSVFVGKNAMVLGNATVFGKARIEDFALVRGEAVIGRQGENDAPVISGHAVVEGKAKVYGQAKIRGHAWVEGQSEVFGRGLVMAHSMLNGARVFGDAVMNQSVMRDKGLAYTGSFGGGAIVGGDSSGAGEFMKEIICEYPTKVDDGHYQYLGYDFEKDSTVLALDQWGLNHSYLMHQPQLVNTEIAGTETTALSLDGKNQYVELRPDALDFAEVTIAFWVKNDSGSPDARVFSLGDGANKQMIFTSGGLLAAKIGGKGQSVKLPSALPKGKWQHIALTFENDLVTIYADGRKVARNARFTIDPDDLHAPLMENANFIGRDTKGHYFKGMIDEFKIIRRALPEAEIAALMKNVAAGKTLTAKRKRLARPTWLAAPTLHGDGLAYRESLSMSAKPGAGSDELYYYFTCESDPSLNSGWISEKKYLPGKALGGSFTVKTKDRFGNVSPESAPAKVSQSPEVFNPPRMIVETKGLGDGEIHLGAPAVSGEGVMVRYRFTREGGDARSGWLARPDWTDENVPRGTEVSYQIEIRDGKGEIHGSHTQKKARGRDDTPPRFSKDERMQWKVFPYTRLDRTVRFTARQNPEKDVEYFFQGVAKPDINSGWIKDSAWVTPPMNRGMHQFRFKIRDNSPQKNESAWSKTKRAKVTPKNTFARYSFTQLATLAPDTLVRFEGRVTAVEPKFYVVGDRNSGASVKVIPRSYGSATLPGMLNQKVTVRGHLWEFEKMGRVVDYAVVARDPQRGRVEFENGILAEEKIFPQYSSAASQSQYLGWHRNGWTVDIPNVAAAKEIYLGYASGGNLKIEVNGELEKEIDLPDGNDADGFKVEKITGFNIPQGADLTFSGNNRIKLDYFEIGVSYHRLAGRVTSAAGQPLANASVFFAREKPVLENTIMQSKTDSEGKFDLLLKDGNWQVLAAADGIGYKISRERAIKVGSNSNADVAFKLAPASYKLNFPRENELIFACISEMLPVSNKISEWQAYYPKGLKLERMSFLGPEYATRDGYRWFLNEFDEGGGFRLPDFQNDIPINGATIIARVDHERNDDGGNWRSIVEVFFDRLLLGVQNWDGKIVAKRNGVYKIYDQKLPEKPVVISMVVQPTGQYKIYLDGEEIISEEEKSDMTQLKVKTGERTFANRISVGRGFDAWSTFNGRIGDVCLYKVALDKNERQTVEKQFMQKR